MNKASEPLIHITRGPLVESIHRGHIAVAEPDGRVIRFAGDPDYVTFARSTAKLLQAVPVVASGAAGAYSFSQPEIALLCASHSGEAQHVTAVYRMLDKLGLDESYLQCGAHEPYHAQTTAEMRRAGEKPGAAHNNCSGKHTGMLALAKHLGAPLETYKLPEHPVQQEMLSLFASFAGLQAADVALGTDGCGVPVYGVPLSRLATAYARLGTPSGPTYADACRTIVQSVSKYPEMLAGSGRFDTALIRATNGRVIGKFGAEGVFAAALTGQGAGLAVKIEDGAGRALYPAVTEALLQLKWITPDECAALSAFHRPAIRNWSGDRVGETVPVFQLHA